MLPRPPTYVGSHQLPEGILPRSAPPTSVAVVPFFIEDKELCVYLEALGFGKTTVKRIRKGNKPTRAVKVYFQNHIELLT